jgi:hypothetical protein
MILKREVYYLNLERVDFRFRCSLSAGRAVSLLGYSACGVSPVPLVPQDKEGFESVTSHEENVIFIFEESRILRSNQLVNEDFRKSFKSTEKNLVK